MIVGGTLECVALSVWIGGLIIIVGAVIPAVFNSFGMEPGGRFLTRVFDGYNRAILIAGAILIVNALWRTVMSRGLYPDLALSRVESMVTISLLVVAALIIFVLEPSSVQLQEKAFAIKDEAGRKAAYEEFFKTHTWVRALYVVEFGLAIVLLPLKLKWMKSEKVVS